ncbi:integrin alpha FG-GAP repeat-containing protein 2 [Mortierella sp. GBA43]|nr:integrin alpha FG-GAP repeat-containing protein 2 [Mortierella sp. GBA43]
MPILLVAQPGLKFVMVDHTGNMSQPISQIQRDPRASVNVMGPDTPTKCVGSGDVATDIICGTRYINGERKDVIGLMSMDGAFALHDLEQNTVKIHDLDSSHKIFGFSKLNFGLECREQRMARDSLRRRKEYEDERGYDEGGNDDDDDDDDGNDTDSDRDTVAETRTLDHGDMGDNRDGGSTGYTKRTKLSKSRKSAPSMLIPGPFGSRFQKDDMFVGCSWSGITFFIDQDFNTMRYDFDARVCAFGAGQYAVTPGRNEPCLFYVDFEDNIYVYYNLFLQTEHSVRLQDIVNADSSLVSASQRIMMKDNANRDYEDMNTRPTNTSAEAAQSDLEAPLVPDVQSNKHPTAPWTEDDMTTFVHSYLYNVNRYEDEFQRLKRLTNIELSKRMAFLGAATSKEREKHEVTRDVATTSTEDCKDASATKDVRPQIPQHLSSVEASGEFVAGSGRLPSKSKAQRGHFSGHGINTSLDSISTQYTRKQHEAARLDEDDQPVSPLSPLAPVSMPSHEPVKSHPGKRRSSLRIKDVLSTYEGAVTPPLKSPISPAIHTSGPLKDTKSGSSSTSSGASTTITSIMKRFSFKDRPTRSSSTSSGSSGGSASGSSQSTITQSKSLLGTPSTPVMSKGRGHEARVSKVLKVNRPKTGSRSIPRSGAGGRKPGTKSRLSQQHPEDDSENDDDQAPSEDGAGGETDGDNVVEFDRLSRQSAGEDDFQQGQDYEADIAGEDYYNRTRCSETNEGEEDIVGAYTPSTISPIPSPGRLCNNQQGNSAEPSASLDSSAFMLARGLLSPSSRSALSGATSVTTISGVMAKTPRHTEQDSGHGSHGHVRQRSRHGHLDTSSSQQPSREVSGVGSGPNSAGHNGTQDGRRSRAESLLSTGSDIGGVIVPDITLMASSFPTQSTIPTLESLSQSTIVQDPSESEDDDSEKLRGSHQGDNEDSMERQQSAAIETGARRPPRRSATLGSQDGTGTGPDTAITRSSAQRSKRSGDGQCSPTKSIDVKLMPAPLPRSNQHHQRQQVEQQKSWGPKDAPILTSGQVSLSSSSRPNSSGGGTLDSQRGDGLNRILSTKSPSATSSATVSDFGSGPSSPLATTITAGNAILSNPSTNSFKGFSALLPLTSPSLSTATVQQQQYFVVSHNNPPHSGTSQYSSKGTHDRGSTYEDDRMSIRSKASTYRGTEDINDPMILAAGTSVATEHSVYGMSPAAASTGTLVSDSLVRRLEELQQQDRDLEKQRLRELEQSRDKGKEKATQPARPSTLSRANSGASVQSSLSHHRIPSYSPTSHGSTSGSAYGSAPASGPPSASASGSGPASGSLGRR